MTTTKKTTSTKKKSTTRKKKVVAEDMTDEQIVNMLKEEEIQMPVETEELMTDITVDNDGIEEHTEEPVPSEEEMSKFEEDFIEYETEEPSEENFIPKLEDTPGKQVLTEDDESPLETLKKEEEKKSEPNPKKVNKSTTRHFYGYDHMGMVYDY